MARSPGPPACCSSWSESRGLIAVLTFIVGRLLGAAVATLLYLLLAPVVVLAPAFGEGGRAAFRTWATRLLGALVAKLVYSLVLGILLLVLRIVEGLGTLGWWTQWLLMSCLWWTAFHRRHQLLEYVTRRARTVAPGPVRGRARLRAGTALLYGREMRRLLREFGPERTPPEIRRRPPRAAAAPRRRSGRAAGRRVRDPVPGPDPRAPEDPTPGERRTRRRRPAERPSAGASPEPPPTAVAGPPPAAALPSARTGATRRARPVRRAPGPPPPPRRPPHERLVRAAPREAARSRGGRHRRALSLQRRAPLDGESQRASRRRRRRRPASGPAGHVSPGAAAGGVATATTAAPPGRCARDRPRGLGRACHRPRARRAATRGGRARAGLERRGRRPAHARPGARAPRTRPHGRRRRRCARRTSAPSANAPPPAETAGPASYPVRGRCRRATTAGGTAGDSVVVRRERQFAESLEGERPQATARSSPSPTSASDAPVVPTADGPARLRATVPAGPLARLIAGALSPARCCCSCSSACSSSRSLRRACRTRRGRRPRDRRRSRSATSRRCICSLYEAAGQRYGIDWAILAGIGKVECDHGRDPDPSCTQEGATNSAGAGGPMQFIASTWARYGVSAASERHAGPLEPGGRDLRRRKLPARIRSPGDYNAAIFAYNHAGWYVAEVEHWAAVYRGAAAAAAAGRGVVGSWPGPRPCCRLTTGTWPSRRPTRRPRWRR